MKNLLALLVFTVLLFACTNAQQATPKLVGAPCEGCEAVFEYGERNLTATDTLPDFQKEGLPIKVSGTVFESDGKTPAKDVVLYVYHTNQEGVYAAREDAEGWGKRHGYNRGWVKTNENGRYSFYTVKPAPYPNRSEAAHIHYTVLEPNGKYYYLQSCHFEGDPYLGTKETNPRSPRGGTSGLLSLRKEGSVWVGNRDIVLGKNVPNYE